MICAVAPSHYRHHPSSTMAEHSQGKEEGPASSDAAEDKQQSTPMDLDSSSSHGPASKHSQDTKGSKASNEGNAHSPKATTTTKSIRNQIIFPTILYDLLKDVEKNDEESIISWTPSGRAVQINKPDEFVDKIFPRYFRHQGGMKQFQRQLKDWGFKRIENGPEDGSCK